MPFFCAIRFANSSCFSVGGSTEEGTVPAGTVLAGIAFSLSIASEHFLKSKRISDSSGTPARTLSDLAYASIFSVGGLIVLDDGGGGQEGGVSGAGEVWGRVGAMRVVRTVGVLGVSVTPAGLRIVRHLLHRSFPARAWRSLVLVMAWVRHLHRYGYVVTVRALVTS